MAYGEWPRRGAFLPHYTRRVESPLRAPARSNGGTLENRHCLSESRLCGPWQAHQLAVCPHPRRRGPLSDQDSLALSVEYRPVGQFSSHRDPDGFNLLQCHLEGQVHRKWEKWAVNPRIHPKVLLKQERAD